MKSVDLTDTGVAAVLSLNSDVKIPADLDAEVHSVSAVGEQFVQLLPRSADGPVLKNGDVIPQDRTRSRRISTRCWTPRTAASRRSRATT